MEGLVHTIIGLGYFALFGAIFAESGLFVGFFLPGDSLLFTAGIIAATGQLNIWVVVIGCFIAAVLGDQFGYWFGNKLGDRFYKMKESFFFKRHYIDQTQDFYKKHGKKTLVIARFTPVVRTFAPIVAGIAKMPYGEFATYNVLGGFLWAVALPLLGYFLGKRIPNIDHYLMPIVIVIIVASFIPPVLHLVAEQKKHGKSGKSDIDSPVLP